LTCPFIQEPNRRLSIHHILSHPFFRTTHPSVPLGPSSITVSEKIPPHFGKEIPKLQKVDCGQLSLIKPFTFSSITKHMKHNQVPPKEKRRTLGDIRNADMRHLLRNELSASAGWSAGHTRRVVSDPLPNKDLGSNLMALKSISPTDDSYTPSSMETYKTLPSRNPQSVTSIQKPKRISQQNYALLSPPESTATAPRAKVQPRHLNLVDGGDPPCHPAGNPDRPGYSEQLEAASTVSFSFAVIS
jgi:hypothetical protein